jgi:hypothetical protein
MSVNTNVTMPEGSPIHPLCTPDPVGPGADREGFQQLVAEVSLSRAGIVLGLECSRLARNSADWHQLLELCGVTGTLICDEDGLYDPRNFNDRLPRATRRSLMCRCPRSAAASLLSAA